MPFSRSLPKAKQSLPALLMPHSTFSRRVAGNERIPACMVSDKYNHFIDYAEYAVVDRLRRIAPNEDDNFGVRDPRELQRAPSASRAPYSSQYE